MLESEIKEEKGTAAGGLAAQRDAVISDMSGDRPIIALVASDGLASDLGNRLGARQRAHRGAAVSDSVLHLVRPEAGIENDKLIAILESDAARQNQISQDASVGPKWEREVHTWPYLMRMEFLVAIIVTVLLMVWSLTLNAPLEEPANPNVTMNPAKAPWYFLGLQEMLVYFDPWIAGVVMPTLIIVGLMVIPYIDANPLGNGYYTYKQRRFSIWTFMFGFVGLWVLMIVIGTFIRGPGWMWFWPGKTWDAERVDYAVNRNLDQVFGIDGSWFAAIYSTFRRIKAPYGPAWFSASFR